MGAYNSCALRASGRVLCWGSLTDGQGAFPAQVDSGVRAVSSGFSFICTISSANAPLCWGLNRDGQTQPPGTIGSVKQLSAGWMHACAVNDTGAVHCWGRASEGQTSVPRDLPAAVQVSSGAYGACAVLTDGSIATGQADAAGRATLSVVVNAVPSSTVDYRVLVAGTLVRSGSVSVGR